MALDLERTFGTTWAV